MSARTLPLADPRPTPVYLGLAGHEHPVPGRVRLADPALDRRPCLFRCPMPGCRLLARRVLPVLPDGTVLLEAPRLDVDGETVTVPFPNSRLRSPRGDLRTSYRLEARWAASGAVRLGLTCADHDSYLVGKPIRGERTRTACDDRCRLARGRSCACSCGGASHGLAWAL